MSRPSKAYTDLSDFIRNRMQMQHIYQPVMLMEMLTRGGSASVPDIAAALLSYDTSQAEYYGQITKNMVGKVLTANHGVAEKIKEGRSIIGYHIPFSNELSDTEIGDLIALCAEAIDEYISKRGDQIWSHRKKSSGYISGTIRYEVLKRAKFRCELCGISADQKALEVDHILPRNSGGTDDLSNLQALCYSCNSMKRDRDDTDFRAISQSYEQREKACIFCEIGSDRIIASNELCYAR